MTIQQNDLSPALAEIAPLVKKIPTDRTQPVILYLDHAYGMHGNCEVHRAKLPPRRSIPEARTLHSAEPGSLGWQFRRIDGGAPAMNAAFASDRFKEIGRFPAKHLRAAIKTVGGACRGDFGIPCDFGAMRDSLSLIFAGVSKTNDPDIHSMYERNRTGYTSNVETMSLVHEPETYFARDGAGVLNVGRYCLKRLARCLKHVAGGKGTTGIVLKASRDGVDGKHMAAIILASEDGARESLLAGMAQPLKR